MSQTPTGRLLGNIKQKQKTVSNISCGVPAERLDSKVKMIPNLVVVLLALLSCSGNCQTQGIVIANFSLLGKVQENMYS